MSEERDLNSFVTYEPLPPARGAATPAHEAVSSKAPQGFWFPWWALVLIPGVIFGASVVRYARGMSDQFGQMITGVVGLGATCVLGAWLTTLAFAFSRRPVYFQVTNPLLRLLLASVVFVGAMAVIAFGAMMIAQRFR